MPKKIHIYKVEGTSKNSKIKELATAIKTIVETRRAASNIVNEYFSAGA